MAKPQTCCLVTLVLVRNIRDLFFNSHTIFGTSRRKVFFNLVFLRPAGRCKLVNEYFLNFVTLSSFYISNYQSNFSESHAKSIKTVPEQLGSEPKKYGLTVKASSSVQLFSCYFCEDEHNSKYGS